MKPSPWLAVVQAALVAGILACVFTIAVRHPVTWDLTPERSFTLSAHTREVIGRITGPVAITVFYSSQEGALRREMTDLLALYEDADPRIRVTLLDLDRSPGAADRLGVTAYNTGVVESGERRAPIDLVSEEVLTSALLQVAALPPVPVWFTSGSGELNPRDEDERRGLSQASRALVAEGFRPDVLDGPPSPSLEAGVLVVAAPASDLSDEAITAIDQWLRHRGGSAVVLADPRASRSLDRLLRPLGVELGHDVVVDDRSRLLGSDGLAARIAHVNGEILPNAGALKALLPVAQTIRLVDAPGVKADYLAVTSEETWADVDGRVLTTADAPFRDGRDRRGPLPAGVYAEIGGTPGQRPGRLVVFGDVDFVSNLYLGLAGNRDLWLAAMTLVGRDAPMAAPRPAMSPGGTLSPIVLTARQATTLLWAAVIVPPALWSLAALAVWLRRRRRG